MGDPGLGTGLWGEMSSPHPTPRFSYASRPCVGSSNRFQSLPGWQPPANMVGAPASLLLREWLQGLGASWAFSLCLAEPGLLGEWPAMASAAAKDDDPENGKKQPTPKDATVPGAQRGTVGPAGGRSPTPQTSLLSAGFPRDLTTAEPERSPELNHFPTQSLLHLLLHSTIQGSWT